MKLAVDCVKKIWDVHTFVEGNTRTTTVFVLKFLNSLGIEDVSNDLFREVEIRIDNMQDAYNLLENQSEQIRIKLLELRSIT